MRENFVQTIRMKVYVSILLLFAALLSVKPVHGQTPDMKATLDYVNDVLGSSFKVTVERGYMNVSFFDGGELFREDNASCKDLDPNKITYNADDQILSISCVTGQDCVLRVYHIRQIRRDYGRISFNKELSEAEAAKLKAAFAHIINMVNDVKYRGTIDL